MAQAFSTASIGLPSRPGTIAIRPLSRPWSFSVKPQAEPIEPTSMSDGSTSISPQAPWMALATISGTRIVSSLPKRDWL